MIQLKQPICKQNVSVSRHMGVSKYRGAPKSSILIGFSIINHPFWGTPIFGNTHIYILRVARLEPSCKPPLNTSADIYRQTNRSSVFEPQSQSPQSCNHTIKDGLPQSTECTQKGNAFRTKMTKSDNTCLTWV